MNQINAGKINAEQLDQAFDEDKEVLDYFDLSNVPRPGLEHKSVNVDFPEWILERLDREAENQGTSRQALIQAWIFERLAAH